MLLKRISADNMDCTDIGSSLSGKELKVAIAHLPTSTIVFRNDTGHVTGFGGSMYNELEWISRKLNFTLNMEVKENSFDNLLANGTWSGIKGLLQRDGVDLACAPYTGTASRDIMELAVYITGQGWAILEKYPIPKGSFSGIFDIFSFKAWICLLASIIAMICYVYMVIILKRKWTQLYGNYFTRLNTLSDTFMCIFGTITSQGGQFRRSDGLTAIIWCLASFVLVNIYSSCLMSYTSLTFQRPDIRSFQDLASNPHFQVLTIKNTFTERIFLEATSGHMKEIGNKLRHCGEACRMTNYENLVEGKVLAGNKVAIMTLSLCDRYMTRTMLKHECQLTIGKEIIAFQNMFMGVPKHSPYVKELNQESYWWVAFGFINYWSNTFHPRSKQCRLNYNSDGESVKVADLVPLKLEQFYLAFLVLFIGYVLALIQFIRERLTHYYGNVQPRAKIEPIIAN